MPRNTGAAMCAVSGHAQYGSIMRPCENCEACEACCECVTCRGCEKVVDEYACEECEHCPGCGCRCDEWPAARVLNPPSNPVFHRGKPCAENPSRRYLAAEIEVAESEQPNDSVLEVVEGWRGGIVEDGSLPEGGYEVVTAPASGDVFIEQIRAITSELAHTGARATKACGLHIHADARDFAYYDLRRLIVLYAHLEPALFALVPASRRASTYCAPCGDQYLRGLKETKMPQLSKRTIIENVYGQPRPDRSSKWGEQRYRAMNLHSWFFRGTIEFRLPSGTTQASKIICWGVLWASILDTAMRKTEAELEALIAQASPYDALLSIAPTEAVKAFVKDRTDQFR